MKLTPDEIRNQRFKTKLKGLDKEDIMTYLQLVADDFEAFQKEISKVKGVVSEQDKIIKGYKEREVKLRFIVDSFKKKEGMSANKEAVNKGEEIIRIALKRANEIKESAKQEAYDMGKNILMLEKKKKQLEESLK